jgi:membrane protease YdiL (CAAX protease family)
MPIDKKTTLSLAEASTVTVICFGLFILASFQAMLAGFPDAQFSEGGNWAMVGVELLLAAAALLYLRSRGFDLVPLYPHPTLRGSVVGFGLFVACWFSGAIVTSALNVASASDVIAFDFDNVSMASRIALAMVNGTFEEVFLLAVLVRGLRGFGLSVAVGMPLLARVLYHLYQGPMGVVWVATFGLVLTLAYLWRKDLWLPVFAHVLWDIVPTL